MTWFQNKTEEVGKVDGMVCQLGPGRTSLREVHKNKSCSTKAVVGQEREKTGKCGILLFKRHNLSPFTSDGLIDQRL